MVLYIIRQSLPWATCNLFGEVHFPYTLKIHFVDFEKEQVHCSYRRLTILFIPNNDLNTYPVSSSSQKLMSRVFHSSLICSFFFFFLVVAKIELVLALNIHERSYLQGVRRYEMNEQRMLFQTFILLPYQRIILHFNIMCWTISR